MSIILKISFIGLVYICVSTILKSYRPEFVFIIRICAVILIFITVLDDISKFITNVLSAFSAFNIESSHIQLILKVVGITLASDYICDVLKDSGESSIANIVTAVSKFLIIYLSLPLLNSLIAFSLKLVE